MVIKQIPDLEIAKIDWEEKLSAQLREALARFPSN